MLREKRQVYILSQFGDQKKKFMKYIFIFFFSGRRMWIYISAYDITYPTTPTRRDLQLMKINGRFVNTNKSCSVHS